MTKKLLKIKEIRERKIRPKNFMKISRDWLKQMPLHKNGKTLLFL